MIFEVPSWPFCDFVKMLELSYSSEKSGFILGEDLIYSAAEHWLTDPFFICSFRWKWE